MGAAPSLGRFTAIAVFFGAIMNTNYPLSMAVLLVLPCKAAGWWGLDRWVLPALGPPWRPGYVFQEDKQQAFTESQASSQLG